MTLGELAAARRAHKAFGSEPVPRETLLELFARLQEAVTRSRGTSSS